MYFHRFPRIGLALASALLTAQAHAVILNETKFKELGGDLSNMQQTLSPVLQSLYQKSLAEQFLPVGRLETTLGSCTATWLGDEGAFSYLVTASHCVPGFFSSWQTYRGGVTGNKFWNPTETQVLAEGAARVFSPPPTDEYTRYCSYRAECAGGADVVLIRLPRKSVPGTTPRAKAQPVIYDGGTASQGPTEFVGNGVFSVGLTGQRYGGRRVWGQTVQESKDLGSEKFIYPEQPDARRWILTADGDSGGAFWQRPWGYWAATSTLSYKSKYSGGPVGHIASYQFAVAPALSKNAAWIKGVFPGALTLSERLTVTDAKPFISRNHADDVSRGTVYYTIPQQLDASGPTAGLWSGSGEYSTIRVILTEERTHDRVEVRLRGQRDHGCGWWSRMEDGVICYGYRKGPLKVSFHAEDNPTLKRGSYVGRFEVEAKGWHESGYQQRFPVNVRIEHLVQAQITASAPTYRSPDFGQTLRTNVDGMFFVVPAQPGVNGPVRPTITSSPMDYTRLQVTVRNVLMQKDERVMLRVQREIPCGKVPMENTARCRNQGRHGTLAVSFVAADNPGLASGLYRGKFWIQAVGVTGDPTTELIRMSVDLDTLK